MKMSVLNNYFAVHITVGGGELKKQVTTLQAGNLIRKLRGPQEWWEEVWQTASVYTTCIFLIF